MSEQTTRTWAPWWHYVIALAVVNGVAQAVGLRHAAPVTNTVTTVVLILATAGAVTWLWHRGYGREGRRPAD